MRDHVKRTALRAGTLIAADVAVVAMLQLLLNLVRGGALGAGVAAAVARAVPPATTPSFQLVLAVVVGLAICGNYRRGDHRRDTHSIVYGSFLGVGLVAWSQIWAGLSVFVLLGFAARAMVVAGAVAVERSWVDRLVRRVRAGSTRHASRTLIVGTTASVKELLTADPFNARYDLDIVGYLHVGTERDPAALGSVDALTTALDGYGAETVIVVGPVPADVFNAVVDIARVGGCEIFALPAGFLQRAQHPKITSRDGVPFIQITRPGLQGYQLAAKRLMDVVVAAAGLIALLPVMVLVAVAVVVDSPGGVFFAQERIGYGARRFRMLKFRTMRSGADAEKRRLAHLNTSGDPRLFKIPNDPRITRVGAWLRKWSLDELPQLINVLRGDMSIVGPRPFFESDLAHYEERHFYRLAAKPGLTGLWQVEGRSSIRDFEEVVRLDSEYIRRWSLGLDVSILLRTLPAVVRHSGAC
ncbi:MAG TPA: exopolysaccharide biosynthesis polyprenyl glycosylphosphotransferase [Gemmatimonadaceae bacterium]|nr:exopolysaccharide biosynthesis polyprenyl glycosylphosphotransferase [Gemmatimonadaceae bacterium]